MGEAFVGGFVLVCSTLLFLYISIPLLLTPFLEDAPQLLRLFPEAEVVVNVSCIAATLIAALLLAALGTVLCSSQLHS